MSFTLQQLLSLEESPQYPLNRRLGGPQTQSPRFGKEKNPLPLPGFERRFVVHPARLVVTISTELFLLARPTGFKLKREPVRHCT